MARRSPPPRAAPEKTLTPLKERGEQGGQPLWVARHGQRSVPTLSGLWKLTLVVRKSYSATLSALPPALSTGRRRRLRPAPGRMGPWRVLALSGTGRFRDHRRGPERQQALLARGVSSAQGRVTQLMQRSEELVARHVSDQPRLQARVPKPGHVILARDGVPPQVGQEVRLRGAGRPLRSDPGGTPEASQARSASLPALLKAGKDRLNALKVPGQGVIADGEETSGRAGA